MFNVPILVKGGKDLAFPGVGMGEGSPVAGPVCPLGNGRSVSDDTLESMQPQQRSGSDLVEDSGDEDEPETSSPPPARPRAALSYCVRAQQLSCIMIQSSIASTTVKVAVEIHIWFLFYMLAFACDQSFTENVSELP